MSETLQETVYLLSHYRSSNQGIIEKIDHFINDHEKLDKPILEELAEELIDLIELEIEGDDNEEEEREADSEVKISDDPSPMYHWSRKHEYMKEKKRRALGSEIMFEDGLSFASEPGMDNFLGVSYIQELTVNEDPYEIDDPLERKGRKNPPINLSKYPDLMMEDVIGMGVDCARFGDDKSVIVVRMGIHVADIQIFHKADVMETTGYAVAAIKEWKPTFLAIDMTGGLGAGVYDRLLELEMDSVCNIFGIEMHSKPPASKFKSADMRTELALNLQERFRDGRITLPAHKDACDEIAYASFEILSTGLFRLVGKKAIKKKLRRSPDIFDALCLAYYEGISLEVY